MLFDVVDSLQPVVNQVEAHPYLQQPELWTFCKQNGEWEPACNQTPVSS
jgi:diketogulonate reductase-like aldo/keto reductase